MPYIGNDLATQFQAFATQTITGDGSTSYTLDRAVANGKELLVYINNVKQEEGSGKSYEASGTTITFSEAVASGDSCYLVYMGSAQQTVTAPAGSIVSSQFSSADLSLTGNVGIGETSPSNLLHVKVSDVGVAPHSSAQIVLERSGTNYLQFLTANTGTSGILFGDGDDADVAQIKYDHSVPAMQFVTQTAEAMRIDGSGHITKPLQPAFYAVNGTDNGNIATNNTEVTINFDTERFDNNSDFNTSTFLFTAPVTGKYQLNVSLNISQIDTATTQYTIRINTSNRNYLLAIDPEFGADLLFPFSISTLADMDANDTAKVTLAQNGGNNQTDVRNDPGSHFSGYLVC